MKTVIGVVCLVLIAGAGLVMLVAPRAGRHTSSPPPAVRGPDAPRFAGATDLLSTSRAHGISCTHERVFNPVQDVAPDAVTYRVPVGRRCDLPGGDSLYVIVYDTREHRIDAARHGEAQQNLCAFTSRSGGSDHAPDSLNTLVAANWRIATLGSAATLASVRAALGGTPEPETLSCKFRS